MCAVPCWAEIGCAWSGCLCSSTSRSVGGRYMVPVVVIVKNTRPSIAGCPPPHLMVSHDTRKLGDPVRPHPAAATDQPRPGIPPRLHPCRVEGRPPAPAPGRRVPLLSAVRIHHHRLSGGLGRDLHGPVRVTRLAAVDADGDHLLVPGGEGERLPERLAGPGGLPPDRSEARRGG